MVKKPQPKEEEPDDEGETLTCFHCDEEFVERPGLPGLTTCEACDELGKTHVASRGNAYDRKGRPVQGRAIWTASGEN